MKSLILSLLLFGVNCQEAGEQEIKVDVESSEELSKHLDAYGYDPRVLGMGSLEDAYDQYNAILNEFNTDQDQFMQNKQVSLLYTFHSSSFSLPNSMSGRVHHEIVLPSMNDLKGYLNFYMFDCDHPLALEETTFGLAGKQSCDVENNPQFMPSLVMIRQPEIKVNPYTGKPMQHESQSYPQGAVDVGKYKTWIKKFLPDYTHKITSKSQHDSLIENPEDKDVNKVVLFTKKEKASPPFLAVSAKFRDQLRFSVVPVTESDPSPDNLALQKQYGIEELPKLVIVQTYDPVTKTLLDEPKITMYGETDYKIPGLSRFLGKFAREDEKAEPEENVEIKQQQTSEEQAKKTNPSAKVYSEVSHQNFTKEVIQSTDAALVYYTTVKDDNITAEFQQFNKLTRTLRGAVKMYVFRVDKEADDFLDIKKEYKLTKIGDHKPELRFYPNQLSGELKGKASFAILFSRDTKDIDPILSEIQENMRHSVMEVQPSLFNSMIMQYALEEQKNIVYYMYEGEKGLSINFMALSNHPLFEDNSVFLALYNPPYEYFEGLTKEMLPNVGVVPKLDVGFTEGHIQQQNIDGGLPFERILGEVARTVGKEQELYEMERGIHKKANKARNFGEITSDQDFVDRCINYRKACAIALIPAVTQIDYEMANFEQHESLLANLDAEAKVQPIYYSWVNITCHPEWLTYFDVDPFQVPTVAYYYPEKQLQSNLIGKFDKETIDESSESFLKGKLPTWSPSIHHDAMKTVTTDCQAALVDDSYDSSDLDDEIMREIMQEAEAAASQAEKEDQEGKKKKKSKGKNKKKKKSSKKDDL